MQHIYSLCNKLADYNGQLLNLGAVAVGWGISLRSFGNLHPESWLPTASFIQPPLERAWWLHFNEPPVPALHLPMYGVPRIRQNTVKQKQNRSNSLTRGRSSSFVLEDYKSHTCPTPGFLVAIKGCLILYSLLKALSLIPPWLHISTESEKSSGFQ